MGVFKDSEVIAYLDGVAGTTTSTTFSAIGSHSGNGGFGNMDGTSAFGTYAYLPYTGKIDEIRYYHNSSPNQDQITDYIRNDGDRTEMIEGIYNVTVTGKYGCTGSGSVDIIGGSNYTDGGAISSDKSICLGNSTTVIANITSPSGGSGPIEYEWFESTDGSNWTLIPGANGEAYSIGAISQTTWYQRRARRVNCIDWNSSNSCKVTVAENFINGGVIDGDEEYCNAYDPIFINVVSGPLGGNGEGTVFYIWEQSANGGASWNAVTAAFGATYDPPTITQTMHYRRGVTRGFCSEWQYSNVVVKAVVYDFVDGGTIAGTEEQCGAYDPITIFNKSLRVDDSNTIRSIFK